jgi:hypothetical protein
MAPPMNETRDRAGAPGLATPGSRPPKGVPGRRRRRLRRGAGMVLLLAAALLGAGRCFLPWVTRSYVNRALDRNPLYKGNIGAVRIHLWRGAYSIEDVRISKTTGGAPVPFFSAKRVDFAVEWKALLHRKAVARVLMDQPELNFVDAPGEGQSQTGFGGAWLLLLQGLFPFKINSAVVQRGSIHFRAYQAAIPVDVYISQLAATVDKLGNIRDETNPLVATVQATGLVMDQAKFEYQMTLDPLSYRPTFHMALRLLGLDATKLNDLALAYGKFDFKRGWFDLVVEADAKEGLITGYAKPLFRNLKVFSLGKDLSEDNALKFFWQALLGGASKLLNNRSRDQLGTLIPFSGDVTGARTADIIAAIGNILRNAFVRAYLPRLEGRLETERDLTFQPPELTDPISAGDSP